MRDFQTRRHPHRGALRRGAVVLLVGAVVGCTPAAPPNVVLVVVDTLRADALGSYGGAVPTPNLDRLAGEGIVFDAAFAPAPSTGPSHATLFTGQEVLRHGVQRNGDPLPEAALTLAESFRAAGYRTGAVVSSFVLDPRFGWSQGFESYDAELSEAGATIQRESAYAGAFWAEHRFEGFDRRAISTSSAAAAWIEQAEEPFFLLVHYFDPHAPYLAPPPYRRRVERQRFDLDGRRVDGIAAPQLELLVRLYHAEVTYVDESLGTLLAALDTRGPTLLSVTADHGEGLGQHRWLEHALHLYDEQVRVPWILHQPGVLPAGARLTTPVGVVDLAPTLLDLAGLPPLPDADGRSLADAVRDGREPTARPIFGHRQAVAATGWGRGLKLSVRDGGWKFIRASEDPDELYHLVEDPDEARNLRGQQPEREATLRARLEDHVAAAPQRGAQQPLPDDTRRALEALGYLEPTP